MYALGMCVDRAYLAPALVVLLSAAEATSTRDRKDIPVRILTSDLSRAEVETLAVVTRRLGFHSFDLRWERPGRNHIIVHGSYISVTTYLRFNFTPEFIGRPYLAYLDADVMIQHDISGPFHDLGDTRIGLVRDTLNHTIGEGPALPGVVARWPTLAGLPYFNAGMMWCPIMMIRALRHRVNLLLIENSPHIFFNDQDALNLWAAHSGQVNAVHACYNSFEIGRFSERGDWIDRVPRQTLEREPAVIHFVGPEKPWQTTCPTTEAVRLYRSYMRQTIRFIRRAGDRTTEFCTAPSPAAKAETKRAKPHTILKKR